MFYFLFRRRRFFFSSSSLSLLLELLSLFIGTEDELPNVATFTESAGGTELGSEGLVVVDNKKEGIGGAAGIFDASADVDDEGTVSIQSKAISRSHIRIFKEFVSLVITQRWL